MLLIEVLFVIINLKVLVVNKNFNCCLCDKLSWFWIVINILGIIFVFLVVGVV